ncbi:hypothetical protein DL96DRAFT_1580654 [Flagelloscypha sp. PMI_526]|nr:hypothetical protein DL96DRAFT_1580654 [Flagelloscypha sp. PMI_526]
MVTLPLDIVPQILGVLPMSDLETCGLVTAAFHAISQEIIFTYHLVLCWKTWRAKSYFFLGESGSHLCARVKNLKLRLEGMPGPYNHLSPRESDSDHKLFALVEKLGPQLDKLSLHGLVGQVCVNWGSSVPWKFHDFLCTKVFPHITSLEVDDFTSIPLLSIVSHCVRLQHLQVGARDGRIAIDEVAPNPIKLPPITNFAIKGFSEADFVSETSLGRYLAASNSKMAYLELSGCAYALSLNFLPPMVSLRSTLQHLNLGTDVYYALRPGYQDDEVWDLLPLPTFPQLHMLTLNMLHISFQFPNWWTLWFKWIAQNLSQPSLPPNFHTLRLVVHNVDQYCVMPPLTASVEMGQLAEYSSIEIHCTLKSNGRYPQRAQVAAGMLRSFLKGWDEVGKLNFWVSDVQAFGNTSL